MEHQQNTNHRTKQILFKVIAMLIPVFILILIEMLLHVFNYGHDTSLFIVDPDDADYWVINKYASQRYFSDTANATLGSIEKFRINKAPHTYRVFVLGESTTAGYPYGHNGSFHRWLKYRLMHNYPDTHFEIINVSLTAVNSYTVLDFGKQIVNYQPNAVLVYTGHNEYYGALGVASTSHIANNRFLVKTVLELRKFRLPQLLEQTIHSLRGISGKPGIDQRENLMKRMAADQNIRYNSDKYHAGIEQFESNMDELCQLMNQKNIPMFLSTLVSNERDQRPFISLDADKLNANKSFKSATIAYSTGNYILAKKLFVQAKELDLLRFRAPVQLNSIIEGLTKKYKNTYLVKAQTEFETRSPHGILGSETMLEHVHPNLYGYAVLSDAFYQSIKAHGLIKNISDHEMTFDELLTKMPVTRMDSLYGAYTIMMLKAGWPFNIPIPEDFKRGQGIEDQLAGALAVNRLSWAEAMNQLFAYSIKQNDKKTALKSVVAVLLEYPQNMTYQIYAGRLSYDIGDFNDAAFYLKMAYDQGRSFENTQNMYLLYLKTDQPEKAMKYIIEGQILHPQDLRLPVLLTTAKQIIQLKNRSASDPGNQEINRQIALSYQAIGMDEPMKSIKNK